MKSFEYLAIVAKVMMIAIVVSACESRSPEPTPEQIQLSTIFPKETISPQPTITPTPTETPYAIPLPASEIITPQNAHEIEIVRRWGRGQVREIEFSPAGEKLALATDLGIWIYEFGNDEYRAFIYATNFSIRHIAWSPDGSIIAASGGNYITGSKSLYLWDSISGEIIAQFSDLGGVSALEWSPNGKEIALGLVSSDGNLGALEMPPREVNILNIEDGTQLKILSNTELITINRVGWLGGGEYLAVYSNNESVIIFETENWTKVGSIDAKGYSTGIDWVDVDTKETFAKYLTRKKSIYIEIFDISGNLARTITHTSNIKLLQVSPKRNYYATVSSSRHWKVTIWSWEKGDLTGELEVEGSSKNSINQLEWSPDEKYLVTVAYGGEVRIWDVGKKEILYSLDGYSEPIWQIDWSSQDMLLINSLGFSVFDNQTLELLTELETSGILSEITWSPDGRFILMGNNSDNGAGPIAIYEPENEWSIRVVNLWREEVFSHSPAWSPDGKRIAVLTRDYDLTSDNIHILDVQSEELIISHSDDDFLFGLDWSPDGEHIVSGTEGGDVIVWDSEALADLRVLKGHDEQIQDVAWSPNGEFIASIGKHSIFVWDASSGEKICSASTPENLFKWVYWNPGTSLIATVGGWEQKAKIWDITSCEVLVEMEGHHYDIFDLSWSPDGRYIATSSPNGTVIFWGVKLEG